MSDTTADREVPSLRRIVEKLAELGALEHPRVAEASHVESFGWARDDCIDVWLDPCSTVVF